MNNDNNLKFALASPDCIWINTVETICYRSMQHPTGTSQNILLS